MGKLPWGGIDRRMAAEDACIQKPGLMDTTGRRRPSREAETAERRCGLQYKCLAGLRQGHGSGCRHENRTEDGRRFRGPRKDVERDLSRLCKLVPRRCARRAFSGGASFSEPKAARCCCIDAVEFCDLRAAPLSVPVGIKSFCASSASRSLPAYATRKQFIAGAGRLDRRKSRREDRARQMCNQSKSNYVKIPRRWR
ncbi:hypothetical protein ACVWZM_004470 [Bradyrhizobium sp. USDA 4501]